MKPVTIPAAGTEYDPRMGVRHVIAGTEHAGHPGKACAVSHALNIGDRETARLDELRAAGMFMLGLIDAVYGTDNEGMDLPEEAAYYRNRAVIEGGQS